MIARIRLTLSGIAHTYRVPDLGQVWRIVAVQGTLVTSATVGNRALRVAVVPKGQATDESSVTSDYMTASSNVKLEARVGAERRSFGANEASFPLPEIWVGGGDLITLDVVGGVAGDNLSDGKLTIEQVSQSRVIEDLT